MGLKAFRRGCISTSSYFAGNFGRSKLLDSVAHRLFFDDIVLGTCLGSSDNVRFSFALGCFQVAGWLRDGCKVTSAMKTQPVFEHAYGEIFVFWHFW